MGANAVPWMVTGAEFGPVYHGGKKKLTEVQLDKLQQRDSGFYGRGFYVTSSPGYAKTYGPRISTFTFVPEARILLSSLKAEDAPPGLVVAVLAHLHSRDIAKAEARGKADQYEDWLRTVPFSPLEWKNAVDRFGSDLAFDAIVHSKGEIVVKNPASLRPA